MPPRIGHRTLVTVILALASTTLHAYSATANVTFAWATSGGESVWQSRSLNVLTAMSDSTYFSTLAGSNSMNYYNADFATAATCGVIVASLGTLTSTRKYGCRYTDNNSNSSFIPTPMFSPGPPASASGTLTVTDTTLTGTLTINPTTDQPTGGTTNSVGTGTNGYNLRSADGSPFGNSWNGVTTAGTYTVNLTGTFTASSWQITGGAARFRDPGFLCQQGGSSSPANILCAASAAPGGYGPAGEALSWGWELDGAASGYGNTVTEIDVLDTNNLLVASLSGVLANLSIDGSGTITTNAGEIRRAVGDSSGCGLGSGVKVIRYDPAAQTLSCGQLTATNLLVTGTVVPVPAAAWLFVSGLGLLGLARRRGR